MNIEFIAHDRAIIEEEFLDKLQLVATNISAACVFPYLLPVVHFYFPDLPVSCLIDFPFGQGFDSVRIHEIIQASKNKSTFVDICINHSLIYDSEWGKLSKDLKTCYKITIDYGMVPRFVFEYGLLNNTQLITLLLLFNKLGIKYIVNSTGFYPDDTCDNAICCELIHKTCPDSHIISTGRIFTNQHVQILKESKVDTVRLNSVANIKGIRCIK